MLHNSLLRHGVPVFGGLYANPLGNPVHECASIRWVSPVTMRYAKVLKFPRIPLMTINASIEVLSDVPLAWS
jgi:hypothetical protein